MLRAFLFPLLMTITLAAQGLAPSAVFEKRCANGVRVLWVEIPGSTTLHIRLMLQGGRADTRDLPPVAAELLARTLLGRALPEDVGQAASLDEALRAEEGAFEALRLAKLRQARNDTQRTDEALVALHDQALSTLRQRDKVAAGFDVFDKLGAWDRKCGASADAVWESLDLPRNRFAAWCELATARLRRLQLARFPLIRDQCLAEPDAAGDRGMSLLLTTAFPGQPYGDVFAWSRSMVESIGWTALRRCAQRQASPDRILLVIAGDFSKDRGFTDIEKSFGTLVAGDPVLAPREHGTENPLEEVPGSRRIQADMPGGPRLFMAWRIPPMSHVDAPVLQVLAALLGKGREARLTRRLTGDAGVAEHLTVRLWVPGGRDVNLLVVEASPKRGRGLPELEQAIQSEILRLQQDALAGEEIHRAQRLVEQDLLMAWDDVDTLTTLLGNTLCEGSDWRLPLRLQNLRGDFTREEAMNAARRYLVPGQVVVAILESDPIFTPQDALEGRLVKLLATLLAPRISDPAELQSVIRATVRQTRMLSLAEREQTLRMLEAQVRP